MIEEIRTVLIASGSGTDANAVMTAYRENQLIPECRIIALLSTVADADCLEKARSHSIPTIHTIPRKGKGKGALGQKVFKGAVLSWLLQQKTNLVFLLGCIHTIPPDGRYRMCNIHPAHTIDHGGHHMFGLKPHKHVLRQILDRLWREMINPDGPFYTYPTVHVATAKVDQGIPLLRATVEIPQRIIELAQASPDNMEKAAEQLQKLVLRYEHLMLPAAVNLACQRILDLQ